MLIAARRYRPRRLLTQPGSLHPVSTLAAWTPHLQAVLRESLERTGVPGAALGVMTGDEQVVLTAGLANVATGEPVHPDTLFQLGGISKLYTTALVLQAARAGLVGLDEPARTVLHDLRLDDPAATLEVTTRHLLTHTSGIAADHLFTGGRDEDALARFLAGLAGIGQIHPPDELYSYCNTGFGIAGRLVEVLTGEHFDRLLRRRLTRPLGGDATVTLPEQALLHRVAVGHLQAPGQVAVRQPRWTLTRPNVPAVGVMAPAGDVLAFVRLHLERGIGPGGSEVLDPAAVDAALEPHVDHPDGLAAQGLGWVLWSWDGTPVVGHDGDTAGQRAFLRMVPARRAALVLLTNSPLGAAVAGPVMQAFGELLDIEPTRLPDPDPAAAPGHVDLQARCGTYEQLHQQVEVHARDGRLHVEVRLDAEMRAVGFADASLGPLEALGGDRHRGIDPRTGLPTVVTFLDPDDRGRPTYLHLGQRAHRLVEQRS